MVVTRLLLVLALVLPTVPAGAVEEPLNLDPWEPMNRRVFAFNNSLDEHLLLPVARGYRKVMPDPAERGVRNFVSNVYEFNSFFNSLLQGEPGNAMKSMGRFLVNTTMGLGGFIDVASPMGIEHTPADFGQTLYTWGLDSGPFVMLPVFGPNTVRGTTGYLVDTYTSLPSYVERREWAYLFWAAEAISLRAELIKAEEIISGDRYIFMRNAYLQRRQYFLTGEIEDSFSEEEEDFVDF